MKLNPAAYAAVSLTCVGLNLAIMGVGDELGSHYLASASVSFVVVVLIGYAMHARWTSNSPSTMSGFLTYTAGMALNLPLQALILFIMCGVLGGSGLVGGATATVLMLAWNVLVTRKALGRHDG